MDRDPLPLGGLDDHLRRVEAERLVVQEGGEEGRRMVVLQIGGFIGRARERRRVALAESVAAEGRDLVKYIVADFRGQSVFDRASNKTGAHLFDFLVRTLACHGSPEQVALAGSEAANSLGHAHHLLLIKHYSQRFLEHRFEGRMQVFHRFEPLAAVQIRMDHLALRGPGAHDGDLDHQVFETHRLHFWQHLHLSPRFDLKYADRVGL